MNHGGEIILPRSCEGMPKRGSEPFDGSSVEKLFHGYWPKITAWVQRMVGCRDVADELTQEAYLRLISASHTQLITHPRAFLYRTAKNLAVDHFRKERAAQTIQVIGLDEAMDVPSEQPSVEQALADRQQMDRFLAALETMPARSREVFLLHRVEKLSYRQIAWRLMISESAVEKNIMRALTHCRKILAEYRPR